MKSILIGIIAAVTAFSSQSSWVNKDIPIKKDDQKSVLHTAYTTAKVSASYPSVISAQCIGGKSQLILLEIGEVLTVDHIDSSILIDGRAVYNTFTWTVVGNKLMFGATDNQELIKAMRRGNSMRIIIETESFNLHASFDLRDFSNSFNSVKQHCKK